MYAHAYMHTLTSIHTYIHTYVQARVGEPVAFDVIAEDVDAGDVVRIYVLEDPVSYVCACVCVCV
jgi:hypothetical protein